MPFRSTSKKNPPPNFQFSSLSTFSPEALNLLTDLPPSVALLPTFLHRRLKRGESHRLGAKMTNLLHHRRKRCHVPSTQSSLEEFREFPQRDTFRGNGRTSFLGGDGERDRFGGYTAWVSTPGKAEYEG